MWNARPATDFMYLISALKLVCVYLQTKLTFQCDCVKLSDSGAGFSTVSYFVPHLIPHLYFFWLFCWHFKHFKKSRWPTPGSDDFSSLPHFLFIPLTVASQHWSIIQCRIRMIRGHFTLCQFLLIDKNKKQSSLTEASGPRCVALCLCDCATTTFN